LANHGTGSTRHIGREKSLKILVTGGMGFIGSNFIRFILSNISDVRIVNFDNLSTGSNPSNLKDIEADARYTFIKVDLTDYSLLSRHVGGADAVVNFAAQTHVDRSIAYPRVFFESNTLGTFNLLEACRERDVRLIQVSTDEVYGEIAEGSFREEDRLKPSNPYSASKAAADLLTVSYCRTYGLNAVITRCTNNFGPYQFPEKLIPKSIIRASLNMKVPVYGKGRNVRDWIYVLDHCEALYLILEKGRAGEVYNISSYNEYENIEVVRKVLHVMGRDESLIEFVEDRPGHDVRYSLDSSKIRNELGWRPKHRFNEALEQTVDWYLRNEWWWRTIATEEVLHPTPWKVNPR
jgi:dTDP-glucose 4,6-dehydratase